MTDGQKNDVQSEVALAKKLAHNALPEESQHKFPTREKLVDILPPEEICCTSHPEKKLIYWKGQAQRQLHRNDRMLKDILMITIDQVAVQKQTP